MSRTHRLKEYKNGKPIYTRHENKNVTYHYFRHELSKIRRGLNRAKRRKQKQHFKKFGELIPIPPTNGWETY